MAVKQVSSKEILLALDTDPSFVHCYLQNQAKKLYTLSVLAIDVAALRLDLERPKGRAATVDPTDSWSLTFRDRSGVYRSQVLELNKQDDRLALSIGPELAFLARRRNIRFALGARNPIKVGFKRQQQRFQARLLDLSMDGLGLLVDHSQPFKVDEQLQEMCFELRGQAVRLRQLPVCHAETVVEDCLTQIRIGVCFRALPDKETEVIRSVFNEWYMSQRPSLSTRVDA